MINEKTFSSIVTKLQTAKDKDGNTLRMDSVAISDGEHYFEYEFGSSIAFNDLRSVSKPVLCMALGISIANGLRVGGQTLSLETEVWSYLSRFVNMRNKANLKHLRELKLKHLLNNTIGHHEGIMFRKDIADRDENSLLDYVFNYDIPHKPGTHFVYSNAGPFIVSVLLQQATGRIASELVEEAIFRKIGVKNYKWRQFGRYCAGCSGLHLANGDLNKIGRLLVDDGKYDGQPVVPADWVRQMRTSLVETPTMYDQKRALPKFGYGHYLWKTPDRNIYCDGTDGQYLIALNDGKTVITTLGHQPDMKPITECFRELLR